MTGRRLLAPILSIGLAFVLAGNVVPGLSQELGPGERAAPQTPVGTAFTYQGLLNTGGEPVNATCNIEFQLFDQATGGSQLGSIVTDVTVTAGLFTAQLDFGNDTFTGKACWLGIRVKCPGDDAFVDLGRQELTATPYAIHAEEAPWDGLIGVPLGFADGVDNVAVVVSGTNTYAGEGLNQLVSGNLITLSVNFAGSGGDYGTAGSAARSDHAHAGDDITSPVPTATLAFSATQTPWSGVTGVPPGLDDGDDDTTYTAGAGLILMGTQFSVVTDTIQHRITGICGADNAIRVINSDGTVMCQPVTGGVGDITAVYPGAGLAGGGTTDAVTLTVAFSGTGTAATAAHSDHGHAGGDITSPVPTATLAFSAAQAPWSGVTGVPPAAGDVTGTYPNLTVTGLQGRSVAATAPTLDQLLRWNGGVWEPTTIAIGDITAVYPGQGLTGGGTTDAVTLTVAFAGTGSAPTSARSDHGHAGGDITSPVPTATLAFSATQAPWSGVTGVPLAAGDVTGTFPNLTVTGLQGRSVAATAPSLDQLLRWNGGVWEPATIDIGDITAVYPGEGLTGGGITDEVTLTVAFAGTGSAATAARSDHAHAGGDITSPVPTATLAFSATQAPWSGITGVPPPAGDVTGTYPNLAVIGLQGRSMAATVPSPDQLLSWTGSAWEPVTVTIHNQAPVAILQANPSVLWLGYPGEIVTKSVVLSLTLSYDPEGGSLSYAFDPTGRTLGTPSAYTAVPTYTAVFSEPGDYLAAGWVRDSEGAYNTGRALISAYMYRFFDSVAVDSTNDQGRYASLAVVAGRAAIAYRDNTGSDLRFVRAADATGTAWGNPVAVDSGGDVGEHASLTVVNGNPAIAYYDVGNGDLKYARADDAQGVSWTISPTVDSAGDVGQYTSLAVVDGRPAVAYYDNSSHNLMYIRAGDASGVSWGTPVTVDSGNDVGRYASLAVVDGRPAIAYHDNNGNALNYVRADDAGGDFWGTPVTVDSGNDVGRYASLAVVDGRPAVAYFDNTSNSLIYVRADDAGGDFWGTPVTVDSGNDVGRYASLAVVDGRPAVAYFDNTSNSLIYVRADDAGGAAWGASVTADDGGGNDVGQYASLAVVDGRPAIAYHDATIRDLLFTMPRRD